MGKPALRIGDLTAHGGTVTVGKPTVLIGKMPASTLGDMHVCPMTTGPVPHVGGPATMGSTGVLLSKMPGARVSDMHVCVGPPSMGAMGCMTVLLGEAGSGGDAGNAATAAAASSASKNGPKAIKAFDPIEPPSPATENHWVEVQVVDSAGLPLGNIRYKIKDPNGADIVGSASSEGRIRHDGYARTGSFKIEFPGVENAKWPSTKCKPNEALKLKADVIGITEGVPAIVVIFEERDNGRFQRQLARIPSQVSGGKVEYFFFVEVEGLIGLSDRAQFREDARIEVLGADGKPVGGKDYQVQLIDGTVRKGKLDKDGKATEKDIPVGPYSLKLLGVEASPVDKKPDFGPGPDPVEGLVFPLPRRPTPSYHKEELRFGAAREDKGAAKRRANGARVPDWEMSRANAGCDLAAPADTPVFAVKDGKVVRGPAGFSSTGQAIEVDHGEFLARYCELKPMTKPVVKAGDAVKQGDVVGYVARSAGVTMLHLEMYSGKAEGPLTVRPERISEGDPESVKRFRRRADLMDPTAWLDRAMVKGEKPAGADDGKDKEADHDSLIPSGKGHLFPLPKRPKASYKNPPLAYGSLRRSKKVPKRRHAGCDLYADLGTEVRAVTDGTVWYTNKFYEGTYEIAVDHGTFIVRYGEVSGNFPTGIKAGAKVIRGQLLGYVGKLNNIPRTMLHFELYRTTSRDPLTNRSNGDYFRRNDLVNPTKFLDELELE